jgi:hypothetical protein
MEEHPARMERVKKNKRFLFIRYLFFA